MQEHRESLIRGIGSKNTQGTKPKPPKKATQQKQIIDVDLDDDIESFSESDKTMLATCSEDEIEEIEPIKTIEAPHSTSSTLKRKILPKSIVNPSPQKALKSNFQQFARPQQSICIDLAETTSDDEKENKDKNSNRSTSSSISTNNQTFFSQQKYMPPRITSQKILNLSSAPFQENAHLLSLLKHNGYTNNYPQVPEGSTPRLDKKGKIILRKRDDCIEGSVILSYVCHDADNNHFAFVVKNFNDDTIGKNLSRWSDWHEKKFKLNSQQHDKNLECIYIFEFQTHPRLNDQACLRQIGKALCDSQVEFPCHFMLSYREYLSQVYSASEAKECYETRAGGISNHVISQTIDAGAQQLQNIAMNYKKIIDTVDEFRSTNRFSQTLENTTQSIFYKTLFSPDEFIAIQTHCTAVLSKLINLQDSLVFCKHPGAETFAERMKEKIQLTKNTLVQLAKIRQEYVGNQKNEQALKIEWRKINAEKSLQGKLNHISNQWLEENNFTVLARLNEARKASNSFFGKAAHHEKLCSFLSEDFKRLHPNNIIENDALIVTC